MALTKENFCKEAKKLIAENHILTPASKNYLTFLDFLIVELKGLPFNNELGETILMRPDAERVVSNLVRYLNAQSKRIKSNKEWNSDSRLISEIYEFQFYEVFKNIIHPNTGIEGICYSLDLAATGDYVPSHFTLDRYFAKSRKKDVIVYRRGCIDLFYDGKMKIFTYEDKWD